MQKRIWGISIFVLCCILLISCFSVVDVDASDVVRCKDYCQKTHKETDAYYHKTCGHIHEGGYFGCPRLVCSHYCTIKHDKNSQNYCSTCKHIHTKSTSHLHVYPCSESCTTKHSSTDFEYCSECKHLHQSNGGTKGKYCKVKKGNKQECRLCGADHDMDEVSSGLKKSAWSTVVVAYAGIFEMEDALEELQTGSKQLALTELLTMSKDGVFMDVYVGVERIYQAITILGTILVMVYFLLELLDTQLNSGFTPELLAKLAIKTLVAFLIIQNGLELVIWAIDFGAEAVDALVSSSYGNGTHPFSKSACPYNDIVDGDFVGIPIGAIGVQINTLIAYLFTQILYIAFKVTVWSRILDVFLRIAMAPIGLSDLLHGGTNAKGINYFKKLVSSLLQGACMLGVVMAYQDIATLLADEAAVGPGWITTILIGLATLTTMRNTSELAKTIIGAD